MAKEASHNKSEEVLAAVNQKIADGAPSYMAALNEERAIESRSKELRDVLRRARIGAQLSQAQLAERLGITQSAVSKIEGGAGDIGVQTIFRFADVLNLHVRIEKANLPQLDEEQELISAGVDIEDGAISASQVKGTPVYTLSGEEIGRVEDVILDARSDQVMFAALGGTLGVEERYAPVPWSMLNYDSKRGGYVVPLSVNDVYKKPMHSIQELVENSSSKLGQWELAPQERNCLMFLATGTRITEIANLVGESEDRINDYMKSALRKVANMIEAREHRTTIYTAPGGYANVKAVAHRAFEAAVEKIRGASPTSEPEYKTGEEVRHKSYPHHNVTKDW